MDVRIETLPPRHVLRLMRMGPYPQMAPMAWAELGQWLHTNGLKERVLSVVGYGLDNPKIVPAHMLRYFACAQIEGGHGGDRDAGIKKRRLHGGRTAIYRMKGPYTQMPAMFEQLHNDWLRKSGHVPDYSRPFLEIYLNDVKEVGMENALTDLCLPIRDDIPKPDTA